MVHVHLFMTVFNFYQILSLPQKNKKFLTDNNSIWFLPHFATPVSWNIVFIFKIKVVPVLILFYLPLVWIWRYSCMYQFVCVLDLKINIVSHQWNVFECLWKHIKMSQVFDTKHLCILSLVSTSTLKGVISNLR